MTSSVRVCLVGVPDDNDIYIQLVTYWIIVLGAMMMIGLQSLGQAFGRDPAYAISDSDLGVHLLYEA